MNFDRLPELGEKIIVVDSNGHENLATVIPRSECMSLSPKLWGEEKFGEDLLSCCRENEKKFKEDDVCYFKYDNDLLVNNYKASFCIMRFRKMNGGYEFNKNIRKVVNK